MNLRASLLLLALVPASQDPVEKPSEPQTVLVEVVDLDDVPLAGAEVELTWSAGEIVTLRESTDGSGGCEFELVPSTRPRKLSVLVQHRGNATQRALAQIWPQDEEPLQLAFKLRPGGELLVHCRDETGEPIANHDCHLTFGGVPDQGFEIPDGAVVLHTQKTNEKGEARFRGLEVGQHKLRVPARRNYQEVSVYKLQVAALTENEPVEVDVPYWYVDEYSSGRVIPSVEIDFERYRLRDLDRRQHYPLTAEGEFFVRGARDATRSFALVKSDAVQEVVSSEFRMTTGEHGIEARLEILTKD